MFFYVSRQSLFLFKEQTRPFSGIKNLFTPVYYGYNQLGLEPKPKLARYYRTE